jgi:hypothetical protein
MGIYSILRCKNTKKATDKTDNRRLFLILHQNHTNGDSIISCQAWRNGRQCQPDHAGSDTGRTE